MLNFVIPVRHPSSIQDPKTAKQQMAQTLASISAQSHPDWTCVIAAERDTNLPSLPPGCEVVWTDIPAPDLPDIRFEKRANRQAVRMDKGARIMSALVAKQPRGHVMVVDYDDLVSRRLAAHSAANPDADGWYIDRGWLYSGKSFMSVYPEDFNRLCGTSLLVHSRLLKIPQSFGDADLDYAAEMLGDHIYIRPHLDELGTPLHPLPFPGAVYRIGHRNSASLSVSMLSRLLNASNMQAREDIVRRWRYVKNFRSPVEMLRGITRLRPINRALRREFFGAGAS